MKKQNLIEAISDFLASDNAGDMKGKYHPEIIKVHLHNAFNQSVYNAWLNGKKYSDFSQLDAWSKTYELTVESQVGTVAHALLTFAPVQLPDGMGIRQVCDHDDNTNVFAPIEATSNVVFAELEVDSMDTTPTYRLEQNNLSTGEGEESHMLRLERLPVAPNAITSIDVMMIVPMDQIGDFDDVVIPAGSEDSLIRQVVDLMSKKPAPDIANDNVPQAPIS